MPKEKKITYAVSQHPNQSPNLGCTDMMCCDLKQAVQARYAMEKYQKKPSGKMDHNTFPFSFSAILPANAH